MSVPAVHDGSVIVETSNANAWEAISGWTMPGESFDVGRCREEIVKIAGKKYVNTYRDVFRGGAEAIPSP